MKTLSQVSNVLDTALDQFLPLPGTEAYEALPQFPKRSPLPFRRTIRRHELRQIVPLAETTIYEMERRGEFPRRFRMSTCEEPALFGRVPVGNEAGDGLIQRELPARRKLSAITAAPPWPR